MQQHPTGPLQMTLQAPTLAAQHTQHGAQHAQRAIQQPSPESQKAKSAPRHSQAQDIFQHSQHLQSQQQQHRPVQAQLQQGPTMSQQQHQQPQHVRPGVAASTALGSQAQPTQSRAAHHVLNLQAKLNMRQAQSQAPAQVQQVPGKLLNQATGQTLGHISASGQTTGQTVTQGQRPGQSSALGQAPGQMQSHPIGYGNQVQQQLPHNQGLPSNAAALPLSQTLHSPARGSTQGLSPGQLPLQTQKAGQLQQSPIQPQHGAAGGMPRTPPPGHGQQGECAQPGTRHTLYA